MTHPARLTAIKLVSAAMQAAKRADDEEVKAAETEKLEKAMASISIQSKQTATESIPYVTYTHMHQPGICTSLTRYACI